jgi:hypothetical protein
MQTDATINQTCEKCGREKVRFYTQQLRSADEGTTVFYTCECGHKYVVVLYLSTSITNIYTGGIPTTERTKSFLIPFTLNEATTDAYAIIMPRLNACHAYFNKNFME